MGAVRESVSLRHEPERAKILRVRIGGQPDHEAPNFQPNSRDSAVSHQRPASAACHQKFARYGASAT